MKHLKLLVFFTIAIGFILLSCNDSNTASDTPNSNSKTELKAGGLYLLKNKDSTFSVVKILAMDNFAIHLRTYSNEFVKKPGQLNSDTLAILIGHAPLDKDGFLQSKPELLKVEEVKDAELEGYTMYLEEMKKSNY